MAGAFGGAAPVSSVTRIRRWRKRAPMGLRRDMAPRVSKAIRQILAPDCRRAHDFRDGANTIDVIGWGYRSMVEGFS